VEGFWRLIREIHRRFLWQAFLIYSVVAYITVQVSQHIAVRRELPEWFTVLAIILLIIGLPIVLITAAVQEGIPIIGRSDPDMRVDIKGASGSSEEVRVRVQPQGLQRLFTWRNAFLGGVAAFTLWALVAVSWLLVAEKIVDSTSEPASQEAPAERQR
jgi:hypothetical protein